MADAVDLKSTGEIHVGSTPTRPITIEIEVPNVLPGERFISAMEHGTSQIYGNLLRLAR